VESWRQSATALSGVINFAATPTRAAGATGRFTLVGASDPATFKVAFTAAPQADRSLNGGVYFGDKDFAAYDATGFVRPIHYPTDGGALDVLLNDNAASFGAATDKDVQLSGGSFAIHAQGSDTLRSLKVSGSHSITLQAGATLALASGGLLAADGTTTITGGAGITTAGGGDLVTRVAGSTDELILDTAIAATTTGGLTKSGGGALILKASNAFTGGVHINGGTLVVGDLGSVLNAGAVTVNFAGSLLVNGALSGATSITVKEGATLGGTGTILGAGVTIAEGAVFDPVGDLTFALGSSTLDLSTTSFGGLRFSLGETSDRIVLNSGTVFLGSEFSLGDFAFTDGGGFAPGAYVLLDTSADILGSLGSTTGTVLGLDATLSFANGANGRDDLILTVVPEPSSAILLLGGLGFLAAPRRRGGRIE
jgi:autotransporter-associated beta strand protein